MYRHNKHFEFSLNITYSEGCLNIKCEYVAYTKKLLAVKNVSSAVVVKKMFST